MNYLADTHFLIWSLQGSPKLSKKGKDILLDENNSIYYSFVNVWDVAIKYALHKDDIPFSLGKFDGFCKQAGFIPLHVKFNHIPVLETLSYARDEAPRNHKDSFDRLLLARAKAENMCFITHDELMPYYHELCVVKV